MPLERVPARTVRSWLGLSVVLLMATVLNGCADDDSPASSSPPGALSDGLVRAVDLPGGTWQDGERSSRAVPTVCGQTDLTERPDPVDDALGAWTLLPDGEAAVDEWIERYPGDSARDMFDAERVDGECTWERSGFRTTERREPGVDLGDENQVVLVTSDTPNSVRYEVVIRSDDVLVLVRLHLREPDREQLDAVVESAWRRASDAAIVDR